MGELIIRADRDVESVRDSKSLEMLTNGLDPTIDTYVRDLPILE